MSAIVAAAALGLGACAGGQAFLPTPEEMVASGAAGKADLDALRRGRVIYVTECAACHRLYAPEEYAPAAWPALARRMGIRASLGEDQVADLTLYLASASRAARTARGRAPAPAPSGGGSAVPAGR